MSDTPNTPREGAPDGFLLDDERRAYARWDVREGTRLIMENGVDFSCEINDLSGAGASIRTALAPQSGDIAIVYVKGFGRFKAEVVRAGRDTVALQFVIENERQRRFLRRLEERVVSDIERRVLEAVAALDDVPEPAGDGEPGDGEPGDESGVLKAGRP